MNKIRQLSVLFFSLLIAAKALGAACCGGGFAAPSLIIGDHKAQLTATISNLQITEDVGADSFWRSRETAEFSESLKIEAVHIFEDRWQAGVSAPVVKRSRAGSSSTGLGDLASTLGYEFLTDWDYNPWRPRGVAFLQVIAPTGSSIQESERLYQLDSRGRGFWSLGFGTVFSKAWGRWDLFTSMDIHHSFPRNYSNSQASGTLEPGNGGNFNLGAGYNLASLRFGGVLTGTYEDPIRVRGTQESTGVAQRYMSAALSINYLFPQEWAGSLSYFDQTLLGDPLNTSLGKGVTLSLQKRWLR